MYKNLFNLLDQRHISAPMLAKVLDLSNGAALKKIKGEYDFKLSEARKVMELFPEYDFDYVFAKEDA